MHITNEQKEAANQTDLVSYLEGKGYTFYKAEYNFYKKEADRLAQQIQKKRQSQNTALRYLQNEQAAKRKKSQLE